MIACIVIATAARKTQVYERVLPSIVYQGFDEIVVVGDWLDDWAGPHVRYLCVEPLLHTTTDALVKRDVGTLATHSDTLVYLCDDHALGPRFGDELRLLLRDEPRSVLVPSRWTIWQGERIELNDGFADGYCGGHCGVFPRSLIAQLPWSAGPHHRNWDLLMSKHQRALGARFVYASSLEVFDLEPEHQPWR